MARTLTWPYIEQIFHKFISLVFFSGKKYLSEENVLIEHALSASFSLYTHTHTRIWIIYTLTRCDPMGNIGWTNHFISFQKKSFFFNGEWERSSVCVCAFFEAKKGRHFALVRAGSKPKNCSISHTDKKPADIGKKRKALFGTSWLSRVLN